ncbi:MAG: cyclic nucleotide-binding domain-containing protein, partial [Candidatus Limnocylindrales bacterium]
PANSAWSSLDNLAFVVGPAIAGVLIAIGGLTAAFALNAVSFAVIAVVLWRLPVAGRRGSPTTRPDAEAADDPKPGPVDDSKPGRVAPNLRSLALRPLVGLGLIDVGAGFAIGGLAILTVVIATRQLGAGDQGTGYLNAAIGVGGLLGAIGSGLVVVRARLTVPLIGGGVLFGLGLVGLGLSPSLAPGFVTLAVASAGSLLVEVVSTTVLQRIVPAGARGRAIGAIETVGTLAYAAGSFALPILADRWGTEPVLAGAAGLVIVANLVGAFLIGRSGSEAGDPGLAAIAERLAGLALFAGIPAFRIATSLARGTTLEIPAGRPIIRQGEPADRFYLVLEGAVEVSRSEGPGEPVRRLRELGPDAPFGELGLLTGAVRSASVTAIGPVRLLALDRPAFLQLVTAGPELAPRLLALHRGGAGVPDAGRVA